MAAALVTVALVPFTWVFMGPLNGVLFRCGLLALLIQQSSDLRVSEAKRCDIVRGWNQLTSNNKASELYAQSLNSFNLLLQWIRHCNKKEDRFSLNKYYSLPQTFNKS